MPGTIAPDNVDLVTIPGVELIDIGTWQCSTGEFEATLEKLQAAVNAQSDPGYCTPILKIGHVPLRGVEWPAVGRIENLRLNAAKTTLIGDYVGVPRWLAEAMPSAFPFRSIEGDHDLKTQTGTKHVFALTAVALLGETPPAISTLEDVKQLVTGEGVLTPSAEVAAGRVTLTRNDRGPLSVTTATAVRAAVSIDALRDAFYDTQPNGSWAWIRECYVGADAFIIVDNDDGELFRIPWTETDGAITFGTPEAVVIEYVAAPASDDTADTGLVLLSRDPIPATRPTVEASMPLTEAQLTEIGLAADADAEAITARLLELGAIAAAERDAALEAATAPTGTPATGLPDGMVAVPAEGLEDLRVAAAQGQAAHETLRVQTRDAYLNGAVRAGRFPPARLAYWQSMYDKDEAGTREFIDKIAAGTLPLVPLGGDGEGDVTSDDALYGALFPQPAAAGGK